MSIWDTARTELTRLSQFDAARTNFGADSHGYQLARPLSERTVRAFERKHRVSLPDDYRSFLVGMGNGGAGPGYGVYPLGRDRSFELFIGAAPVWIRWPAKLVSRLQRPWRKLGEPFPFRDAISSAERRRILSEPSDATEDVDVVPTGAISICTHGCGLGDWLVVTGEEAGQVWHDASAEYDPSAQERIPALGWRPWTNPDGDRMTFADWWTNWLVRSLAGQPLDLPRDEPSADEHAPD